MDKDVQSASDKTTSVCFSSLRHVVLLIGHSTLHEKFTHNCVHLADDCSEKIRKACSCYSHYCIIGKTLETIKESLMIIVEYSCLCKLLLSFKLSV